MNKRPDGSVLANPRNERIRATRALSGRSVRKRTGQFLIEGPRSVREAVEFADVNQVFITAETSDRYPQIIELAQRREIRVSYATEEVIAHVSPDAQGVCAVGNQELATHDEVFALNPRLVVVLHEARDPGNVGTVIRAADAAGADAVVMTQNSVDLYNPKVIRSTVGSMFHLPIVTNVAVESALGAARQGGMRTLAADAGGERNIDHLVPQDFPAVWVFGNEAHGLSPQILNEVDDVIRVPIYGNAESLNLAMAATVCLYASARTINISQV